MLPSYCTGDARPRSPSLHARPIAGEDRPALLARVRLSPKLGGGLSKLRSSQSASIQWAADLTDAPTARRFLHAPSTERE